MTVSEVADRCSLPMVQAELAKRREYDEPFVALDPALAPSLLNEIERLGKHWTRGGRFYHVLGAGHSKAEAVRRLRAVFEARHGHVRTIGLGDGWTDLEFLRLMDEPVIVRSPVAAELSAHIPSANVTGRPGPEGWAEYFLGRSGS